MDLADPPHRVPSVDFAPLVRTSHPVLRRGEYGLSDEELLLRYMVPGDDLEASVSDVVARFGELKRTRSLRVEHPEFCLDLTRPQAVGTP